MKVFIPVFDLNEPLQEKSLADWQDEDDRMNWVGREILASLPDPGGCGQKLSADNSNDIVGPQSFTGKGNRK